MKFSVFNYEKTLDNNVIIFNTLTRSIISIERGEYYQLKENIKKINYHTAKKKYKDLCELGFIADDDIDEFLLYKYWLNKQKWQNEYFIVTFLTTYNCNFKCPYCYEGFKKEKNYKNMELDKMLQFLENVIIKSRCRVIDFNFFGGEPLLEMKTIEKVCMFLCYIENNFEIRSLVNIVTNGYLIDEKMIENFKKLNINSFQITIDGIERCHDERRFLHDGSGTFKKIYNNLLMLIDNGFEIVINMNFDKYNYRSIIKFLDIFPEKYRNKVYIKFNSLIRTENNISRVHKLKPDELAIIYKTLLKSLKIYGYNKENAEFIGYGPCLANRKNSIIIEPNGNISKCIYGIGSDKFIIGNIKDDTDMILLKLYSYDEDEIEYEERCKTCTFLPFCMGGCKREKIENKYDINKVLCKKEEIQNGIVEGIIQLCT